MTTPLQRYFTKCDTATFLTKTLYKMSYSNIEDSCKIDDKFLELHTLILINNQATERYVPELNKFLQWCNECYETIQKCGTSIKNDRINEYDKRFQQILNKRNEMITLIGKIINLLLEIQNMVLQRLDQWKHEQFLIANRFPTSFKINNEHSELDQIQNWFDQLFNSNISMRQTIDVIHKSDVQTNIFNKNEVEMNRKTVLNLLRQLISSSIVIQKQPPQVIKKDTRFDASVRMLITYFSKASNKPCVTVSILSEAQALVQLNQLPPLTKVSGSISNNVADFQFENEKRSLTCNLNKMMITEVKRLDEKESIAITSQMYALSFQSKLRMDDTTFDVWTMSLPVVVITFGSQEPQAWATITWNNAFGDIQRNPFSAVDNVTWSSLASVLNTKFESYVGSSLTYEDFRYLYGKIFGTTEITADATISLTQFCKNSLPDREFTFWGWFYAIMKLTRDHLREPWNLGLITGFISRHDTEKRLINCPRGTFLLRYSDSVLGGISIAWVEYNSNQKPEVIMLQPYTSEDFKYSSFSVGDVIKGITECTHLYPNIPKEMAFGRFCKQKNRKYFGVTHVMRRMISIK